LLALGAAKKTSGHLFLRKRQKTFCPLLIFLIQIVQYWTSIYLSFSDHRGMPNAIIERNYLWVYHGVETLKAKVVVLEDGPAGLEQQNLPSSLLVQN